MPEFAGIHLLVLFFHVLHVAEFPIRLFLYYRGLFPYSGTTRRVDKKHRCLLLRRGLFSSPILKVLPTLRLGDVGPTYSFNSPISRSRNSKSLRLRSRRSCLRLIVRSPLVRSVMLRAISVNLLRPPVIASG